MKKLLALILCVMMFVSVIPTMAFAEYNNSVAGWKGFDGDPTSKDDPKFETVAAYKKQIEKMIENTKKNVATAYGVLAMDQVVYSSAKSMDDVIVGLIDQLADQLVGKEIAGLKPTGKITAADVKGYKDNSLKPHMRALIQSLVIDELSGDTSYKDADGKIDPLKYGQAVANAVNKALNNEKFQAGYQAVATYFSLMSVADSINTELKKQRDEFKASIDTGFDKDFSTNYAQLFKALNEEYVDTLNENFEATGEYFGAENYPWAAYVTPAVGAWS